MHGGRGMVERGQVMVENRQAALELGAEVIRMLERVGRQALALIVERELLRGVRIDGAAVFLVDDARIGTVHGEFFDDPSPTDVITFPMDNYGEILVSVETAQRQAAEVGVPWEREMALYVVHGLLHLCGYEDQSTEGRERMAELQDAIVVEVY